jgi:Peptidase family M28
MRMLIVLTIVLMFSGICMATDRTYNKPEISVDQKQLYSSVEKLTSLNPSRNYKNVDSLNEAAGFIKGEFLKHGYSPAEQKYRIKGNEYKNILASYGPETAPRFIVGAHYDVAGEQPGADDNASGIAALLALAELFKKHSPQINFRIDFVAYTLEEPPFFRTKSMGSFIHAKSLHDSKVHVLGMLSLEMIGYYSDSPESQFYPLPFMKLFYPTKADFIGVVGNFSSSKLIKHFKNTMNLTALAVESLKAPSCLIGVDFSDHMNYWKFRYPAIMLTDTAFYRNFNYHSVSDTIYTLNFDKMKEVVKGVYWALINLEAR